MKNMEKRLEYIEDSSYKDEESMIKHWSTDNLQASFPQHKIDDITDISNSSAYQYLISLDSPGLFSQEIDKFLEEKDAYYMEVYISDHRPLAYISFWKYERGGQGQKLEVSDQPFLKKHKPSYKKLLAYLKSNNLILLEYQDLKLQLFDEEEDRKVSFYYKYFNQSYPQDPFKIPF